MNRSRNGRRTGEGSLVPFEPPFARLTPEERARVGEQIRTTASRSYEDSSRQLDERLLANEPLQTLAEVGFLHFIWQDAPSTPPDSRVSQHHLELCQALALRHALTDFSPEPYSAATVYEVAKLLRTNAQMYDLRSGPALGAAEAEVRKALVVEQMRSDTQFVRGEYHAHQGDRYLRSVLARIEQPFLRVHGTSPIAVLDTIWALLRGLETRLNRLTKLRFLLNQAGRGRKAISTYFKQLPEDIPLQERILAEMATRAVPTEMVGLYLWEQSWRHLSRLMTFSLADLHALVVNGADRDAVLQALRKLSISFGELADVPAPNLHLNNPVWERPFIVLEDGGLFWASPNGFFSFGFRMFEHLIDEDAELKRAYDRARGKFLEEELGALLRRGFPGAQVLTHCRSGPPENLENDAIVILDRTAFLFEAKAGRVTAAARRGGSERLLREITKLMVEPAVQSARLKKRMRAATGPLLFDTDEGRQEIDPREIDTYVRVNVTLNIIGSLSSGWRELMEAGFIDPAIEQAPTMNISDLDVLLDVLEDPGVVSHYLRRRDELERRASYRADEHDLIAFYLETGFNIGEGEYDGLHHMIYGMSDRLRPHYDRRIDGRKPPKPRARRSRRWNGILKRLNERRPANWLDFAYRLLNVPYDHQVEFERQLPAQAKHVRRSKSPVESLAAELLSGPPQRREALALCVYKAPDKHSAQARLQLHAARSIEATGADTVLVLGIDAHEPERPYHLLGLLSRRELNELQA